MHGSKTFSTCKKEKWDKFNSSYTHEEHRSEWINLKWFREFGFPLVSCFNLLCAGGGLGMKMEKADWDSETFDFSLFGSVQLLAEGGRTIEKCKLSRNEINLLCTRTRTGCKSCCVTQTKPPSIVNFSGLPDSLSQPKKRPEKCFSEFLHNPQCQSELTEIVNIIFMQIATLIKN